MANDSRPRTPPPHVKRRPSTDAAAENSSPAATHDTWRWPPLRPAVSGTRVGSATAGGPNLPSPNCPDALSPNAYKCPSRVAASVWNMPHATCDTRTDGRLKRTRRGSGSSSLSGALLKVWRKLWPPFLGVAG